MKTKCSVCETENKLDKNKLYQATDTNILTRDISIWDCIDCEVCGCQIVLRKRLNRVMKIKE